MSGCGDLLGNAEGGHEAAVSADGDACDDVLDEGLLLVDITASDDMADVPGDVVECGRVGRRGLFGDDVFEFNLAVAKLLPFGAELGEPLVDVLVVTVEFAVLERVEVAVDLRSDGSEFGVHGDEFLSTVLVVGVVIMLGGFNGLGNEVLPGAVELGGGVKKGLVQVVGVEPRHVALLGPEALECPAGVVAVGLGLAGRAGADHGLTALGTVQFAGGDVVRGVGGTMAHAFPALLHEPLRLGEHLGDGFNAANFAMALQAPHSVAAWQIWRGWGVRATPEKEVQSDEQPP